eukprot:gb/GFBE01051093.1/.p1 GENE.gb/GFBE01051093.1/~~gb/GFBE01051093.1/.p1  ORF type:complete len:143 (+),score=13.34 gb/GFBE01051093.1/:1-429(+)
MSKAASSFGNSQMRTEKGKMTPRQLDNSLRMKQLTQHGAVAASSPAAMNRVAVPGPGAYTMSPRAQEIIKPVNSRFAMPKKPRFAKEGALFSPGIESQVPGPGTYNAHDTACIGKYKVGKVADPPKWTMRGRPIMEFAKTSC